MQSPESAKPWSSGRVLTEAQREQKRQKDRVTKRVRSQKQNEYIKQLEQQVIALQQQVELLSGR